MDSTSFIKASNADDKDLKENTQKYYRTEIALSLIKFIITHKPCCRLRGVAWLIPHVAAGVPAGDLVAYALEALADLMNDPTSPFRPDCTSVGNSWLHRLGIYLLHHCSVEGLPPDPSLVRVMSLVALPPSASIKSGKATRIHDYLSNSEYPRYLHYASAAQAVGKALALELLDELDANRQTEHFRRIERAVAFYAVQLINGATEPSIKSIEVASGLSWADARKLVQRPYFKRLVFQHQCRHLAAHPESDCAECASLRAEEAESRVYESSLSKVI